MIIEGMLADIDGARWGQLRIENETIVEIGERLGSPTIGFSKDCLIFAGMGDIHIHAREDASGKECYKEDFRSASEAAVAGGVVHVADMPNNPTAPVDDERYEEKQRLLNGERPPVHFTLYAGIGPGTRPLKRSVPYKAYMGPSVGSLFFSTNAELDETLRHYRGLPVSFHCEDPEILVRYRQETTHERRRPPACELSATRFALDMIERYSLVGKLCHYSVGEGLPLIADAKRRGVPVTAEVTPHHLFFDTSMLDEQNRPWMQMNPPLRSPSDRTAMIDGLRNGTADYLATDHAPHTIEEKKKGVSGQPHLDTYGPFVTWLLREQGFTPERVAAICSANPGLFIAPFSAEKYGRLLPGYVASLTVLHLNRPTQIIRDRLKTKCGWSPFEGVHFPGSVEAVFIRGKRHHFDK